MKDKNYIMTEFPKGFIQRMQVMNVFIFTYTVISWN